MDKVFEQATVGIAGALQVLAFESGITSIYEADLRAATRRAVQTHLAQKVVVEAPVKLARWKVGAADIAVRKAKGAGYGAIAELKLWKDIAKIDETIWDAWKLASAYKEFVAGFTHLIAVGPSSAWQSGRPLLELWEPGTWSTKTLWQAHSALMRGWMTTGGPHALPAGLKTSLIGRVPIHVTRGEDWEIRCSRVTTTPGPAFAVPAQPA